MKKNILKTIILFLMILIIISSFTILSSASSITYYNGNSINISNSDQIEILSTEVKIDTINSIIGISTIIRNTSNKSREETIDIPIKNDIVETQIKTLKILVNDVEVKYETDKENYRFNIKIKPNEAKKILVVYQTENDLKKAKVLKYNFENLNLGDKIIKKAKVDIVLQESDIPLVTKVYPGHYTVKGNTISIEYYNFKVNSLTKDVIVEKETYDNLLYGREVALTDIDKKILDLVPKWEKDGISINYSTDISEPAYDNSRYVKFDYIIERLTGEKIEYDVDGKNISETSKAIVTYYLAKKLTSDNETSYISSLISNQNVEEDRPLLNDLILLNCSNEKFPLLGKIVCIDYVKTMDNEDLYVDKNIDLSNECNIVTELTKKDELTILTTNLYNLAKGPETGAKLIFLGKDIEATDEEKVEYVNMINADMYIRTMLYNGKYEETPYEDFHDGYVGYNGKDNLPIAKAFVKGDTNFTYREYTEEEYYDEVLKDNSSDYGLLHSEIPCVIQYVGCIEERDGKKVIDYFWDGFYDYIDRGLATTDDVLQTSRAKQLLQANKSKNEKIKQDIEIELSNLKIEKDEKEPVKEEGSNIVNQQEETVQEKSLVEIIKENLNTIIFICIGIVLVLIIICTINLIIGRKNK